MALQRTIEAQELRRDKDADLRMLRSLPGFVFADDAQASEIVERGTASEGRVTLFRLAVPDDRWGYAQQFAPAVVHIRAVTTAALEHTSRLARELLGWYNRVLFGKKIAAGGRPAGSGTFADEGELLKKLAAAVSVAKRKHRGEVAMRTVCAQCR